jgi:hypothetical protein
MSTSPTPSERDRADKEAKAKEEAEQAALPYKWTQTIQDVDIIVPIDAKYKGKDLDIKIGKNTLRAAIKGGEAFLDVSLSPFHQTANYVTKSLSIQS